ncbi:MAG: hypothetical protein HY297_00550 [Thaumarchaeota archaeon]|nr:hypothetical protein [Nitrososphaerota archaeon]
MGDERRLVSMTSLASTALGLGVFAVGAALMSVAALGGIALAAAGVVTYTWKSLGRTAVTVGIAGSVIGAVAAWVAMRSMMRWVAASSGIELTLTLGGTAAILGAAVLMSILPGMAYVHFRRRFGATLLKSLAFGAILSGLGGVPLVALLYGEIAGLARVPAIPIAFLLLVPVLFAATLDGAYRVLERPKPGSG